MSHHDPLIAYPDDPGGDTVHQPYTAFLQGWDAAEEGLPESLNPYPDGSEERTWWAWGYGNCELAEMGQDDFDF